MESTISKTLSLSTPSSLNPFISRLHRYVSRSLHRQCLPSRLIAHRLRCFYADRIRSPSFTPAHLLSPLASMRCTLQCVLGSTAPVCACGGCGGGSGSNGGSGGGRVDGEDRKAILVVDGAEEASAVSSDVIVLNVGGMTCGGFAASVKRILENQEKWLSSSALTLDSHKYLPPVSILQPKPQLYGLYLKPRLYLTGKKNLEKYLQNA